MNHVLIIEDEVPVAEGLADNLRFEGFQVVVAHSGEDGLRKLRRRACDLLLLDLMLPGMNGFEVLRELSTRQEIPRVLVLSARDAEADIVRALDLGAHDYVRKPFGLAELLARVRTQLREVSPTDSSPSVPDETRFGDVRVVLSRYRVWKGDREHLLSHTEVGLLRCFLAQPDRPLRRADLIAEVWGDDAYPTERTVDNFILKLRKKIEDDPSVPSILRTVHGVGYCFTPGVEEPGPTG